MSIDSMVKAMDKLTAAEEKIAEALHRLGPEQAALAASVRRLADSTTRFYSRSANDQRRIKELVATIDRLK